MQGWHNPCLTDAEGGLPDYIQLNTEENATIYEKENPSN
jgi:hypothetical protein